jgi:hypothetical protein
VAFSERETIRPPEYTSSASDPSKFKEVMRKYFSTSFGVSTRSIRQLLLALAKMIDPLSVAGLTLAIFDDLLKLAEKTAEIVQDIRTFDEVGIISGRYTDLRLIIDRYPPSCMTRSWTKEIKRQYFAYSCLKRRRQGVTIYHYVLI